MNEPIRAIETRYAGCRFRSRTEARWAVWFDRMDWPWEFEPEGFKLPGGNYLPDFRLTTPWGVRWFEVKPYLGTQLLMEARWTDLARATQTPVHVAYGMHRTGDDCQTAWETEQKPYRHAGRIILPDGLNGVVGPYWTEPEYAAAWDAASSARFEFGESG